MDISDIISTEFPEFPPEARVSKLVGTFDDPSIKGVIVRGDEYKGVVTRRQLATTHHQPGEKVGSIVWHVPQLAPDEDVRKVAELMIASDTHILPVFEDDTLTGVVTVDSILQAVQSFLDVLQVEDVYSRELVTVTPDATFGSALNRLRENRITHLPVVENGSAKGILSLYDITSITVRSIQQSQGGDPDGTDPFGGSISNSAGRSRRGGFGAREGEMARIVDLPVRDVMISPVRTTNPESTLESALEKMFSIDGSSLIVTDEDTPVGILTKTDILDSLTWEAGGNRAVQVYGIDLLDDITYSDIIKMVDKFDDRDHGMAVLDARIHLQKHNEKRRGTPLLLARIRLHTDRGLFLASGEGYGATHALNQARDVLERQIRDHKTYGRSKKPPTEEFWEKRFGWLLE